MIRTLAVAAVLLLASSVPLMAAENLDAAPKRPMWIAAVDAVAASCGVILVNLMMTSKRGHRE